MKPALHPALTVEKWHKQGLSRQLLNILSELTRATEAVERQDRLSAEVSVERTLELIDLTVEVMPKATRRLKEILRFREALCMAWTAPIWDKRDWCLMQHALISLDPTLLQMGIELPTV